MAFNITSENAKARAALSVQARKKKKAFLAALALPVNGNKAEPVLPADSTIARRLESASALVQVTMSDKLIEQSQVLSQRKALSMLDLATQQPLVKSLVDTADKLYGWSRQDQPRCLVQVGVMAQFAPKAEEETPQPVVSCGVQAEPVIDITTASTAQTEANP
jgi:hypothetical protein